MDLQTALRFSPDWRKGTYSKRHPDLQLILSDDPILFFFLHEIFHIPWAIYVSTAQPIHALSSQPYNRIASDFGARLRRQMKLR
jgi:hypothetical protein